MLLSGYEQIWKFKFFDFKNTGRMGLNQLEIQFRAIQFRCFWTTFAHFDKSGGSFSAQKEVERAIKTKGKLFKKTKLWQVKTKQDILSTTTRMQKFLSQTQNRLWLKSVKSGLSLKKEPWLIRCPLHRCATIHILMETIGITALALGAHLGIFECREPAVSIYILYKWQLWMTLF